MGPRSHRNVSPPARNWPEPRRCPGGSPWPDGRCATYEPCPPIGATHHPSPRPDAPGPSTTTTPRGSDPNTPTSPTGRSRCRPTGRYAAPPNPTESPRPRDGRSQRSPGPSPPNTPRNGAANRPGGPDARNSGTTGRNPARRPRRTTPTPTNAGRPRNGPSHRRRTAPTDPGPTTAGHPPPCRRSHRNGPSCGHGRDGGRWPRSTTPA